MDTITIITKEEKKNLAIEKRKQYNQQYSKEKYSKDSTFKAKELLRAIRRQHINNETLSPIIDKIFLEKDDKIMKQKLYDVRLLLFKEKNKFLLT
jgi:hypothetical protein